MVLEDREDHIIEVSGYVYKTKSELFDNYIEIWKDTHILADIKKVDIEI